MQVKIHVKKHKTKKSDIIWLRSVKTHHYLKNGKVIKRTTLRVPCIGCVCVGGGGEGGQNLCLLMLGISLPFMTKGPRLFLFLVLWQTKSFSKVF